jgi:hypothetical protein
MARPAQLDPYSQPDEWVIKKNNTTVETFTNKRQAEARAKELAKNQNETLAVFKATNKTSDQYDYRTEEEKSRRAERANRRAAKRGLSENFGPL